jgi:cell division protein FtsX
MKFQLKLIDRSSIIRLSILAVIIVSLLIFGWSLMVWMPGESYRQALPPLSAIEIELKDNLQRDVQTLATKIGSRNVGNYQNLVAAKDFLSQELATAGYTVKEQKYTVDGQTFSNLEVEIPGSTLAEQILVIGGHYDSAFTSPGADDNGTGAAAVLSLA